MLFFATFFCCWTSFEIIKIVFTLTKVYFLRAYGVFAILSEFMVLQLQMSEQQKEMFFYWKKLRKIRIKHLYEDHKSRKPLSSLKKDHLASFWTHNEPSAYKSTCISMTKQTIKPTGSDGHFMTTRMVTIAQSKSYKK